VIRSTSTSSGRPSPQRVSMTVVRVSVASDRCALQGPSAGRTSPFENGTSPFGNGAVRRGLCGASAADN
jgi:hypothetical protein